MYANVLDLPNVWIHEPVGFAVKHEGTFGVIMVTCKYVSALWLPAVQFAI